MPSSPPLKFMAKMTHKKTQYDGNTDTENLGGMI